MNKRKLLNKKKFERNEITIIKLRDHVQLCGVVISKLKDDVQIRNNRIESLMKREELALEQRDINFHELSKVGRERDGLKHSVLVWKLLALSLGVIISVHAIMDYAGI